MNEKPRTLSRFSVVIAGAICLCVSLGSVAQPPPGIGTFPGPAGGPKTPGELFSRPMGGAGGVQEEEQITILIKQGKKIYCAWSNQLLHNDVEFKEVTPEEAEQFYDDGTHNDEVPFDGLPSNVDIKNNDFISPYGLAIKERFEDLKAKVLSLETINNYRVDEWKEEGRWDPTRFYSGLHVTSLSRKSDLPLFAEKLAELSDTMDIFEDSAIAPLSGYKYYPDKENPGWERRLWRKVAPKERAVRKKFGLKRGQSLVAKEQAESGRGGMMGGMMGGMGGMGGPSGSYGIGRAKDAAAEYEDRY